MEYFTITDAMSGQDMTARFIGAVQTPHAPHCGPGTAAGGDLMKHLKRGRAEAAAEVIGDTGYGMAKDLAWADAELISRIADRPQATPSVISKGGNVMWSGVRVSVCRGIAYVRARGGQVHLFGVCPVLN